MTSATHSNDRRHLVRYFRQEEALYAELAAVNPKYVGFEKGLSHWLRRTRQAWRSLNQDNVAIPTSFLQPYAFSKTMFSRNSTEDPNKAALHEVQLKYQLRGHNILREFDRCVKLFPEVLDADQSYSILELSSGACGGAEVATEFGNSYQATDYLAGRGSAYEAIHTSLGLKCFDFDGTKLPYSFKTKSFDHVLCFQAIDAYGPEEQYPKFIDEMLRIARKKVVIIFNPGLRGKRRAAVNTFEKLIRAPITERYNAARFEQCPSTGSPALILEPSSEEA